MAYDAKRVDTDISRENPANHRAIRDCSPYIASNRQQILEYPSELLPVDAQFKGYEEVVVQDIKLTTDAIAL